MFLDQLSKQAMKNAHRTELERELERARKANNNTENADIEEIHNSTSQLFLYASQCSAAAPLHSFDKYKQLSLQIELLEMIYKATPLPHIYDAFF